MKKTKTLIAAVVALLVGGAMLMPVQQAQAASSYEKYSAWSQVFSPDFESYKNWRKMYKNKFKDYLAEAIGVEEPDDLDDFEIDPTKIDWKEMKEELQDDPDDESQRYFVDSVEEAMMLAGKVVDTNQLADGAVTNSKIDSDAVTSTKIDDNTITGADLSSSIDISTSGDVTVTGDVDLSGGDFVMPRSSSNIDASDTCSDNGGMIYDETDNQVFICINGDWEQVSIVP